MFSFSVVFGFLLLLGVLSIYVNCLHINVKRKNYVQLNGVKIDANSLHKYLEQHEKELIFGKNKKKGEVKLVQIERRDQQRHKRSAQSEKDISLQIQDNGKLVDLKLQQAEKLVDDAFIFIRRTANTSQFIENSHKLAVNYERCFYRNANSALDLCDDSSMRGIVYHNSTHYMVHPLPERFGIGSHVIVEFNGGLHSDIDLAEGIQFEPHKEAFEASELDPNSYHHHRRGGRNRNNDKLSKRNHRRRRRRRRRHIGRQPWKIPQVLYIETAIFVDRDLFKHMAKNFPRNTESQLVRFVLAMINGVQLLYNHPSLGHRINFVLKRLEILHPHPKDLRQSSDIDTYLNNFCMWQRNFNPPSDVDPLHYDHAVILTGLDLYVVGKNGKVSNQVVGLAPVAGMCTTTSSCTINEGKHFESVFVVAHEIGHNLGMRHDTNENSCDPSLYLMSPTLGSGKITWSKCSRTYLNTFLESSQSKCLFDHGQVSVKYDHAAEGILPGERFDADQQCMLKYGRDSVRSPNQIISDICRDLHCQRDRYTWTSHPALEGTSCGEMMRCRSGVCSMKATFMESYSSSRQINPAKSNEKMNLLENDEKSDRLNQGGYNSYFTKAPIWSEWGDASDCDSGCLYGASGRLREGSTGLKTYVRTCLDHRRRCQGRDKRFESCIAKQCLTIPKMTIEEFATNICERAQKFDSDLTGEGLQIVGNTEESCKVFCQTKSNGTKSRNWIYPHGTTCRSKEFNFDDTSFCVDGRCERFSCDNSTKNYFKMDPYYCPQQRINEEESKRSNNVYKPSDERRVFKTIRGAPTPERNKFENEVVGRNFQTSRTKWKSDSYQNQWKYPMSINEKEPLESEWEVKSGCHSSCMEKSKGVQVISSKKTRANSIQLCTHKVKPCDRLQTTTEFAESTCGRYSRKVRGLSGYGMQISPSVYDPDRSCRVACQDELLEHRFYIVNGNYGHFPLGTKCSVTDERYCVNGKCLEFGTNNIASTQSHISLALFRSKRDITIANNEETQDSKSFISSAPVHITELLTQDFLNSIINSLSNESRSLDDDSLSNDHIEFTNPIHISTDELITE
ncbi:A disintegrin and metalloproteinase with thrombospondin motifs 16 isoform X1 [Episyrphus balteatus]|uniref:A disintegrin and metalloproteinase with thrombospondin motifs 16 isoform X1 n=1 Tax=Episyrphus balteatus TaxID=286459 RepID=UPI002486B8CF|nr:A disintegrin and metalloproteinase with thrombospondin motifs 16 isoform X1 [Episyrphus balteatus]